MIYKNFLQGKDFMDKRKRHRFITERTKPKIKEGAFLFLRSILGVFCCFFGIYCFVFLAKSGSDVFYYAMAFASPGTAIEMLSAPIEKEELPEETPPKEEEPVSQEEETPKEPQKPQKTVPEVLEENRGKVTETQYSAKEGGIYVGYKNAVIKNSTHHSAEKIKSVLQKEHGLSLIKDLAKPQVLIYHTHATEGYEPADRGYFDITGTWRSTDPSENMISVGNSLVSALESKGIAVIHDATMHDDPSYNGSYRRSAVTIQKHLEENPSVKIALDIHRDAIEPSKTEIIKPTAVINGKKAAQIMIISGCDDGTMNMPDYWENLRFAAALADKLEELYPGICRPILFDYRKYNMDLSPGLLLIEIGATGNTLEEAQYSAELLGNALSELLSE